LISVRYLINANGASFEAGDLKKIESALDKLDEKERKKYRDDNAATISRHDSSKILIVSGPGTGKTHLFLDRIDHWLTNHQDGKVLVTSFVRKLVADLQNGIDNDQKLTKSQKSQTEVSTLHKFARSIVEKSNGTTNWKFKPHFRVISQSWKDVVWKDVLEYYSVPDQRIHTWQTFESQLHNMAFLESNTWKGLRQTYFELCKFYNAAGFADLIVRAVDALRENSTLNTYDYLVIDEYQDFNLAEKSLIFELARNSKGLLIAGDDDQVLYEKLKSGKSEFIRKLYNTPQIAKAMLPFCGRSSYHITKTAHHFIKSHSDSNRIEKVFLPLSLINSMKVQFVACACPSTAVDYIDKFISDNKAEIDKRRDSILNGEERDAYLLILTPANDIRFYGKHSATLQKIVSDYQIDRRELSEDCYKIIDYASLGR
jgi:superfamily I DNA/RNA helicase